ncbi:MAG: hypothetical protein NT139_00490 [Candidatus Woesearchaeota archaeon]|jgi:flagellin-like protein|nr:hypothetical protein [Candidatus Woesearchaeota archaeon]
MNKKGISPLIATVLLIGFTVALAAVIMTWGGGFVRDMTRNTEQSTQSALKCTQLDFKIQRASCTGLTIENKGSVDIKSFVFRVYDTSGAVTTPIPATNYYLAIQMVKTYSFTIPSGSQKVETIASVAGDSNESIPCSAYVATEDSPC